MRIIYIVLTFIIAATASVFSLNINSKSYTGYRYFLMMKEFDMVPIRKCVDSYNKMYRKSSIRILKEKYQGNLKLIYSKGGSIAGYKLSQKIPDDEYDSLYFTDRGIYLFFIYTKKLKDCTALESHDRNNFTSEEYEKIIKKIGKHLYKKE